MNDLTANTATSAQIGNSQTGNSQTGNSQTGNSQTGEPAHRNLPPEALRALAEAAERRKAATAAELPTELGGRDGPEPVRYGDWEKKGLAIDF